MKSATIFSNHALDRVVDRLHLSFEAVKEIIDQDKAIMLGFEPRTRKVHLLFYSTADDDYFVAVLDERVREVVTILPFNFDHFRYSFYKMRRFKVVKLRAKEKIIGINENADNEPPRVLPKQFFLLLYFRNYLSHKLRVIRLTIEADNYPEGLVQIEKDPAIHTMINECALMSCEPNESFEDAFIRRGKRGSPERFALLR